MRASRYNLFELQKSLAEMNMNVELCVLGAVPLDVLEFLFNLPEWHSGVSVQQSEKIWYSSLF